MDQDDFEDSGWGGRAQVETFSHPQAPVVNMANISWQSWFLSSDPSVLEETGNIAFLQGHCTREAAQGKNGLSLSAAHEESNENNVWKLSSCDLTSLEESSPLHRIALISSS